MLNWNFLLPNYLALFLLHDFSLSPGTIVILATVCSFMGELFFVVNNGLHYARDHREIPWLSFAFSRLEIR